jgi:23S rRNA (pseudouridine1915-N3)-methyltransferase
MKAIHLIVVGKLKDKNLESIESDYAQRIRNPDLKIHEVRANAENIDIEASNVVKKISEINVKTKSSIFALAENGSEFNSVNFSNFVFNELEINQSVIFIIAGACGHGKEVLDIINGKISLSKLTFPHKIARIIFVEQFYRALTIHNAHPYHN